MKNYLKSSKKNTSRHPTSMNPLLTLVVTTLLSAPIVNANAELIVHSEPNRVSKDTNNIAKQQMNNQAPTDVSIIKLMQVMHIDAQIQSIVNGQQAAIDAINTQTKNQNKSSNQRASDQQLNKRQRELQEQIQSVLGQYAKIMTEGIGNAADAQTLTQAYISAAKTYYTQAEVDAQIKFYDTAVGQSILAKQPQITAAFLQQSLPEDTSETEAQLSELLPQMKQIIKGVF